jgi:SAM-dependent methyltransferase
MNTENVMDYPPKVMRMFRIAAYNNERFWERMGNKPDFTGKRVMDFGCALGGLTIDIAASGAEKVVGLDIDAGNIEIARRYMNERYPHLANKIEYVCQDINTYPEIEQFDYVVTRNTFEHVIHLPEAVQAIKKRLKVGGQLYAGFGPLYNSPLGDHRWTKTLIPWGPWGHVLLNEAQIVKLYNRRFEPPIQSIHDLGLNKLAFADYERIFRTADMKIVSYRLNQPKNRSLLMRGIAETFSLLRQLPFLREYFTFNIYCILEKQA